MLNVTVGSWSHHRVDLDMQGFRLDGLQPGSLPSLEVLALSSWSFCVCCLVSYEYVVCM
jgi:hypothetical protein